MSNPLGPIAGHPHPVYIVNTTTAVTIPYNIAVARGEIAGVDENRIFGRAPSAGTTPYTLWDGNGNAVYPGFIAAPGVVSIVSSSANDAAAGTGMRTLRIEGLDANYNRQTVNVTLNGLTPVATTETFIRVFQIVGTSGGSAESNQGTITATIGGVTVAIISTTTGATSGFGQSLQAIYTVPAGMVMELYNVFAAVGRGATLVGRLDTKNFGTSIWRTREVFEVTDCPYTPPLRLSPLIIQEKTDLRLMGAVTQATGLISGGFEFYLRTV